jgi:uncharacterized membrane protein
MNFPDGLFSPLWSWAGLGVYGMVLMFAVLSAPWQRLKESEQLHVFLGACVALMVLWTLRAGVLPGLNFHLLGATLLVLMFGWRLALVGLALVLAGVTLSGKSGISAYALNALTITVVPVLMSHAVQRAATRWLPAHFFVYVFVHGFFNAVIAMAVTGVVSSLAFLAGGVYGWDQLAGDYLPVYLLMVFPEAILTGTAISLMVVYRPAWVASFDDEHYLKNK